MIRTSQASPTRAIALLAACVVCLFALPVLAADAAAPTVRYTKESAQAYQQQLAGGQIQSATFNKRVRSLHLTLKNGSHVLTIYGAHEEPKLAAALEAKGIPVTVLKPADAAKEAAAKPVHHKLRYIAGGVLIVVILVVGAVLLVDRRRKLAAE
jgi:hypothetical protein